MDTMTEFVQQRFGFSIDQFIVSGASKRGWAAWTLAAVDERIVGLAPMVMDELNFLENVKHHFQVCICFYWSRL